MRAGDMAGDGPAAGRFPATSWALLGAAAGDAGAHEEFRSRYYDPVFAFIAAKVHDLDKARDLTQEFFATRVLSGRVVAGADRAKGSFRHYLRRAIRNFLIDVARKEARSPAAGVRIDAVDASSGVVIPDPGQQPDAEFHRAWVRALLGRALLRVEAICAARGQQAHLELFVARYLDESGKAPGWGELGERFQLDEKAARNRAETVARHLRLVLREMMDQEVGEEGDVNHEIAALLAPL
jgi:DNA-directed RNA polymerase specialized sigma24 family protein